MISKLIMRRIGGALITVFFASIVIFVLVRFAPGDPIDIALGVGPGDLGINTAMLEERKIELRKEYGLYDSIPIQYLNWLKKLITFDFGRSIYTGYPVTQEIGNRIPATVLLAVSALFLQMFFGVILGVYSALKVGKFQDGAIRFVCIIFASLPAFVLSLLLLFIFSVKLHQYGISSSAGFNRLWLPAITMGLVGSPQSIRMVRATMLSEFGQLYVSASLSRGLPKRHVLLGAFRNALLPIVTTLALSFAHLIGGTVVIESIFNWPGLGNYALNSILVNDYFAIQGYTVLTVATVILINLMVEIIYIMANPRERANHRQRI